ncbi:MAG TPA: tripartite tricarboxylate transporter permease [Thermodesulfobacteriota bacterium]|nr:tripartite tricarboxylate transporter permease [Thermodesulfobacteriota bacterium]
MVFEGLLTILSLKNLFYIAVATAGGLAIGALPGLTATMGVALLVPFTFVMGPVSGLAILGAIYMSAIYGGCFSAILINTPGTPGSIATAFDGYPMAKKGEGAKAIFAATYASMFGGLLSLMALFFLSPPLAKIALKFGPPEYFWLAIFGMTVISSLGEGSLIKTFMSGGIGLLLSCIGITHMGGELRFGFGWYQLQGGIELVAALIGLFCIPEALNFMGQSASSIYEIEKIQKKQGIWLSYIREFWSTRITLIRSSLIGILIGILPGAGGTIANVVAYNDAKTYSRKAGFGTGIMEGIVAPESANNATVGGGLIPTLTLGVPGTPVDAIILGALMLHSLHPGPQLFQKSGVIVYSFMWALVISTLMMGVIGLSIGVITYRGVSKVPTRYLAPTIIFLSIIGSYALRNNLADVWMMLALGLIGYGFRLLGMSTSAAVLGLVLGQIAEEGLVQASILSQASSILKVFFLRPISAIIVALAVLTLLWPVISSVLTKQKKERA